MTVKVNGKLVGRLTNAQKEQAESKKLKRVALKDISTGTATQLCLETFNAPAVLDLLDGIGITIDSCEMGYRNREATVKIETPKKLSEFGSIYHRKGGTDETIEVFLTQTSVADAKSSLSAVAQHYGKNESEFAMRKLRIRKGDAILVFRYMLKDIPMNHDKRTKVRVLALMKINREPELERKANQILAKFTLAKYVCKFHTEEKKVAMCSRMA